MPRGTPLLPFVPLNDPQNNLSQHLKWADHAMRMQALQHCMDSSAIDDYLQKREERKRIPIQQCSKEDIEKMTKLGAGNRRWFDTYAKAMLQSAVIEASTPLKRSDTSGCLQNLVKKEFETHQSEVSVTSSELLERKRQPNDSSNSIYDQKRNDFQENPEIVHVLHDLSMEVDASPARSAQKVIEIDDDSVFTSVDVDALIESHSKKKVSADYKELQREAPRIEAYIAPRECNERSFSRQAIESPQETDSVMLNSIRDKIDRVRKSLRNVREECDDASITGEIPNELLCKRSELEEELKILGRRLRKLMSAAAPNAATDNCATETAYTRNLHGTSSGPNETETSTKLALIQNTWEDSKVSGPPSSISEGSFVSSTSTKADVNIKMKRAKIVLHDIFGHTSFRPNQEQVVLRAFEGQDVFVLMPTGGGKSLCYQLPACIDSGITVVISPLVSLIQDQVQQLEALEVGVAHLVGDQDYVKVQRPIMSELFSNKDRIKLLYVTPEKIANSNVLGNLFRSLERRNRLARFVIDEAHCISQWGHDFRKDYMALGQLRVQYPSVRIMALTATANSQTEADIIRNLKLENPFITRSSFNRPNLTYDVRKKSSNFMTEIVSFVKEHQDDSGIIYCLSKKDCEQLSEKLIKLLGYENTRKASQISFYHAGLETDERTFRHNEWSKGKIKLIVATVAFGMGINKPDVRYVIHHTIPQSVTHYYQEAGRAGRDGYVANCILYYSFPDLTRRRKLITKDQDNKQHQNVHFQNLRRMIEFCENQVECRRTSLLEYFGEHFESESCKKTCDNCKNRLNSTQMEKSNVTEDCVALLRMVRQLQDESEPVTLVQASQLFLGIIPKGKEKKKNKLSRLACFGRGKNRYERSEVERIVYHMILRQYLGEMDKKNMMGFTTTFLECGAAANDLIQGEQVKIVFKTRRTSKMVAKSSDSSFFSPDEKPVKKKKKKIKVQSEPQHTMEETTDDIVQVSSKSVSTPPKSVQRIPKEHVESLAQLLKDWRASVCDSFNVMPYHILPTSGIAAIANAVPMTSAELMDIDGVGRIRVKKYGEAIISIVKCYLQKHHIQPVGTFQEAEHKSSALFSPYVFKTAAKNESISKKRPAEDDFDDG